MNHQRSPEALALGEVTGYINSVNCALNLENGSHKNGHINST